MKKHGKTLGIVLLFVVGLSILLYPTISNMWNTFRERQLISSYSNTVASGGVNTDDLLEQARAYNAGIQEEAVPDAFSVRDGITDTTYESLLNVNGDGMMGYIEIPAINVQIPIYHYTSTESLQKGVGHLFGSSLPVGGEGTHAVMSAHRGLPSAKLFTDLDLVKEGDVFYIHVLDQILAYQVDDIRVVLPDQTETLGISQGEDLVTLVTCTPYAVNSHRILVRGHRIDFDQNVYDATVSPTAKPKTTSILIRILCVLIGIAIALILVKVINHRNKKKRLKQTSEDQPGSERDNIGERSGDNGKEGTEETKENSETENS